MWVGWAKAWLLNVVVPMGGVQFVKLLKLRVVPELLYVLQEFGVLSRAANFHRATTQVSTKTNRAMVATTYTDIDSGEKERRERRKATSGSI